MRRYRRAPRRQGVVYGPALGRGPSHGPSLAGRLAGALVVIGALALMAAVTWAFLGRDRGPTAVLPTPTAGATESPAPAASPSPPASIRPSPLPSAPVTLPPTASPTPLLIEVREGPGTITFASDYDDDLNLIDKRTSFASSERIAWSAQLIEPAGARQLTIEVARYDPDEDTETVVNTFTQRIRNPSTSRLLRRIGAQRLVDGPGIYIVRYLRGERVLAEGWLRIED